MPGSTVARWTLAPSGGLIENDAARRGAYQPELVPDLEQERGRRGRRNQAEEAAAQGGFQAMPGQEAQRLVEDDLAPDVQAHHHRCLGAEEADRQRLQHERQERRKQQQARHDEARQPRAEGGTPAVTTKARAPAASP